MKIKHLLLALPMLFYSCGEQTENKSFIHIDMTNLMEADVQKIPLNEWAKNVLFIPLETNNDILIKNINAVFQKEDNFLVMHGYTRISIFSKEGKYLYDISSQGEGPTNFISISNVTLHNDLIYIHETNNRIKAYDWKGNFVKKIELPAKVNGLITMDGKDEMLAYVPNLLGDEPTRFYLLKDETVIDSIPNPFIYPKAAFAQTFYPEFQPTFGHMKGFIELHSDTLYLVDKKWKTHPYLSINVGKYQPTRKERYNVSLADIRKNPMFGKNTLRVTGEINHRIFMYGSQTPQSEETFCYDKRTQEASKLLLSYPENSLDIPEDAAFKPRTIVKNNYLVDWEQPDNDENPIIVLVEP